MFDSWLSKVRRLSVRMSTLLLILLALTTLSVSLLALRVKREQLQLSLLATAAELQHSVARTAGAGELLLGNAVAAANASLQLLVDEVGARHPRLGLGIYSRGLDSIVAIYPFRPELLRAVPRSYPYFESYDTGEPAFNYARNSLGWSGATIYCVTYPIYAGGEVVGHTWANIRTNDLLWQTLRTAAIVLALGSAVWFLLHRLIWRLFHALQSDLQSFTAGLEAGPERPQKAVVAELQPLLGLIQQQKQALRREIELREQAKRQLEQLFELSLDMIVISRELRYVKVNPAVCRLTGYTAAEIVGKPTDFFVHPDDRDKQNRARDQASADGSAALEVRMVCADGSTRLISWQSVVQNGDVYSIGRDVTQERAMEQQLSKLDKLNLAGEMAAAISHEIRNPLTTVRGFLQLAKIRSDPALFSRYCPLMMEELDRANSIITEYLALCKDKLHKRRAADLNAVIGRLEPLLRAEAVASLHELVLDLQELPPLRIDEDETRQLILNLVKNALEAMSSPGQVTIRTRLAAGWARLEVHDQGSGIPEAILQRLGTPFLTTKEHGNGLGLAVCYRIAERHGARVEVKTGEQGTCISVLFAVE